MDRTNADSNMPRPSNQSAADWLPKKIFGDTLKQREISSEVLAVALAEMGKTPVIIRF